MKLNQVCQSVGHVLQRAWNHIWKVSVVSVGVSVKNARVLPRIGLWSFTAITILILQPAALKPGQWPWEISHPNHHKSLLFGLPTHYPLKYKGVSVLGGPLSVMKVWWIPANDKSTQDYFGHAIILSDTHMYLSNIWGDFPPTLYSTCDRNVWSP